MDIWICRYAYRLLDVDIDVDINLDIWDLTASSFHVSPLQMYVCHFGGNNMPLRRFILQYFAWKYWDAFNWIPPVLFNAQIQRNMFLFRSFFARFGHMQGPQETIDRIVACMPLPISWDWQNDWQYVEQKKKSPFSTMIYTKKMVWHSIGNHFNWIARKKKRVYWWNCFWVAKKTRSKRRWHRWAGWRSTIKCDIYHLLTTQTAYANGFIRICLLSVHVWFINANWLCF